MAKPPSFSAVDLLLAGRKAPAKSTTRRRRPPQPAAARKTAVVRPPLTGNPQTDALLRHQPIALPPDYYKQHGTIGGAAREISKFATGVDPAHPLRDPFSLALLPLSVIPPIRGAKALYTGVRAAQAAEKGGRIAAAAAAASETLRTAQPLREAVSKIRTLTVGEKVQQLPRARSRVTQTLIEKPADAASRALMGEGRTARAARKVLPTATAEARVAKAAGRETAIEAQRAQAAMAAHVKALPKAGSPEDIAHFWWAQLPKAHRNLQGLQLVRAKQGDELARIAKGDALAGLQRQKASVEAKLRTAQGRDRFQQMQNLQDVKLRISDLPGRQKDIARSLELLDKTIAKAPTVNAKAIAAVQAISGDRRKVLEQAGVLDPQRAAERQGLVSRWLGLDPTGQEAFIGHRGGKVRGAQATLVPASPGLGRPRLPQGVSAENKLVLAKSGRLIPSTHIAAQDWRAAQTYRSSLRARADLAAMGKPFEGRVPEGYMLVNPKGRPVPPHWKTDPLAKLLASGHNEDQVRQAADAITSNFLAGPDKAAELLKAAKEQGISWHELRVVPEKTVNRYYGQFQSARAGGAVGKAYDSAVNFAVASIIFARIGYIPKNVAQNLIMAAPHQGPLLLANVPRAAQVLRNPTLRPLISSEVGLSGPTTALGQEFTQKLAGIPGKAAGAVSGVADTPLRISAFIHEAAAAGVIPKLKPHLDAKDERELLRLLTDPKQRPLLNDIRSRSVEAMADFSRLTPAQRKWARRYLIIPGWLWAGSRYPFHFAATHPGRSAALAYAAAGEPGAPKRLQVNKPINEYFAKGLPSYLQGIPTGGGKVLRTSSLSPVSTPWDVAMSAAGRNANTIGDYTNPLAATLWNIAHRTVDSPTGPYRADYKTAVVRNLERLAPSKKLVSDLISPPKASRVYPGDASRIERLKREIGVIPIKVGKNTAGVARQQADALTLVKKLGIGSDLPAPAKKSYARLAEREAAWKKATNGKKPGTRDYTVAKYKADLELARKWGYLTPAQTQRAEQWVAHAPVDDVNKAHRALSGQGGIYDKAFTPARETEAWLKAQDAYATDLGQAVKTGTLTQQQASRARAWARKAQRQEIDKARTALERIQLAGAR